MERLVPNRTEFYRGPVKVRFDRCRALAFGAQCGMLPMLLSPMHLPEGSRTVGTDKLRLCKFHFEDYDGWPGTAEEAKGLDAFNAPPPDVEPVIIKADAPAFIPKRWPPDPSELMYMRRFHGGRF